MRTMILLACLIGNAVAADRTHAIVPADYFTLATIMEVAVSPDGKHVAFAEARWDRAADDRKSDVWVLATDGKSKPQRLTFDRANDHKLKWSEDSKTIYFLGNRKREAEKKAPYDGKMQVWSVPVGGGTPRAVTSVEGGVTGYDLAPAVDAVVYSVDAKARDEDDFAKLRATYKLDYGHGVRTVSELFKLDLGTWKAERIYAEGRYVREFAVTRDGKRVAMVTALDDSVVKSEGESRVDVLEDGKVVTPPTDAYRKNAASPHAWLENLAWSTGGKHLAFNAIYDGHPANLVLVSSNESDWSVNVRSLREESAVAGYGRASGLMNQWVGDDFLFYLSEHHGTATVNATMPSTDRFHIQRHGDLHVYGFSVGQSGITKNEDGAITKMTLESTHIVADPHGFASLAHNAKGVRQAGYDPNPHTAAWKLPTVKHITWKAPDGSSVGGVLELPPGCDGKGKLPLVVAIHGGPTTSSKAALEFDPHNGRMYFSTAGYAVLCPNYRGSTGYGDKFVTDLIGNENDIEVKDIIAGVQHLVKEGIADGDRVGVMGWSNGGYLTNCLITRKDLPFKLRAASSGAGIVDTVAEWGFNDEPAYPKVFKKGHPWETPDVYKKTSPTYDLGNIKTPTIIHVGGNDVRCPPGHSRMLYRAMKEYLNVPTELCEYPGEPHGLGKWSHRQAKMEWDLAWFEKYLKNAK
jgi:dipeptidyl aminopeptidase/acylaminoacyl peptidase